MEPQACNLREFIIAKNTNTFLKKKREVEKKAKAAAKRERRAQKKRANEQSTLDPDTKATTDERCSSTAAVGRTWIS